MATTEHTINDALAGVLRETRRPWKDSKVVLSENTGKLHGNSKRPDILVLELNVSPVAIETEVLPAASNVEAEALSRLGEKISKTGSTILSAIAVRLPERLREKHGGELANELRTATDLDLALYTGKSADKATRYPNTGWILGTVADLSILTQSASIPPEVVGELVDQLVDGVSQAAGLLEEMSHAHQGAMQKICAELRQADGEQTRRMATTILANAFVFHESIAGGADKLAEVKSLGELRSDSGIAKAAVLQEWRKILEVNYWPIFDIARRILDVIPATYSRTIIERLVTTAEKLLENHLMRSHDLTGAVFQRLIADRKFLAAYYTTPASAALLMGLAITRSKPLTADEWSDADKVKALRIADFACGTGTLSSTAYQRIGQLHELAGGDSEAIHAEMMADAIVGCDVLPAAAHLTASMLAGAHPTVKYKKSSIMTVAYGKQPNKTVALGSIDLLDPQRSIEVASVTAKSAGGEGESEHETWIAIPHDSFDLVVMNPPFTRATGHEGKKVGVHNPMFAAFTATKVEQAAMAKSTKALTKNTSYHGNAGEASIFFVLADRKLKEEGVLALVMPLSFLTGEAWKASRTLLAKRYTDIVLVSIAGATDDEMSFSADTGMGECLLIARKAKIVSFVGKKIKPASDRATFVVLKARPESKLLGATAAEQISRLIADKKTRSLEDGPVGGTPVYFGTDIVGQALDAPVSLTGIWNPTRVSDLSLAQAAYQMSHEKKIWLPMMSQKDAGRIPMTTVGKIGKIGPYHSDIDGLTQDKSIRGPFKHVSLQPDQVPTYPILWEHAADRERTLSFEADCEGLPRQGKDETERIKIEKKIEAVLASASHCHFNQNFRFNSQSTAMQFTERPTIGGRAWTSIKLSTVEEEKALVVWANTSFGLLLHWYHANRQQAGRGNIVPTSLSSLPVLDVGALSAKQQVAAVKIFDEMKKEPLLTINEIGYDPVREKLDARFSSEVLGMNEALLEPNGPVDMLRRKLASEPSISGRKTASQKQTMKIAVSSG